MMVRIHLDPLGTRTIEVYTTNEDVCRPVLLVSSRVTKEPPQTRKGRYEYHSRYCCDRPRDCGYRARSPAGLMTATAVTVTRTYDLATGQAPRGKVVFRPSERFVNESTVVEAPVVAYLDLNGSISIALYANTDPGSSPSGTGYHVREEITGHWAGVNAHDSANAPVITEYFIVVPHDAGSPLALHELLSDPPVPTSQAAPAGTRVRVDGVYVPELDIDSDAIQIGDLDGVSQEDATVGGYLTAAQVTDPGTADAVVTEWQVINPPPTLPEPNNWTGRYIYPVSQSAVSTSNALTNGTLRLAPWFVPNPITIDRIGAEITVVGDSGCKLRLGIYSDNGFAFPGARLLDAGQIAGDSATVQDLTVSQAIPAGLYWVGGVVQSVTTTQPTVRITNSVTLPIPIVGSNSTPAAGTTVVGYSQTSVTGALPSNFTTSIATSGSVPRVHVRIA